MAVKIADFGISKETQELATMTGFIGTTSYMSPEMVLGEKYTEKVDVYSYGILLWEMYTHELPFASMPPLHVATQVVQGLRPKIPPNCPAKLSTLMEMCWDRDQLKRPSFGDVLSYLNVL
jgi:serine/threonine protein kinase